MTVDTHCHFVLIAGVARQCPGTDRSSATAELPWTPLSPQDLDPLRDPRVPGPRSHPEQGPRPSCGLVGPGHPNFRDAFGVSTGFRGWGGQGMLLKTSVACRLCSALSAPGWCTRGCKFLGCGLHLDVPAPPLAGHPDRAAGLLRSETGSNWSHPGTLFILHPNIPLFYLSISLLFMVSLELGKLLGGPRTSIKSSLGLNQSNQGGEKISTYLPAYLCPPSYTIYQSDSLSLSKYLLSQSSLSIYYLFIYQLCLPVMCLPTYLCICPSAYPSIHLST